MKTLQFASGCGVMKNLFIISSVFFVLGSGFYFLSPYLQLNTEPKNWENGYQQPVTPRLKNTLNGLGKGF
jgi:hypothetical protein